MSAQRLAFAQSKRIDQTAVSMTEFGQLYRSGKSSLNIHRLSDTAQCIMLGYVFPDGCVSASDIAQFRSQSAEFYATCRTTSASATDTLLDGKEYGSFYAGMTLVVVKRGLTVSPFFPVDLPIYGPSRGMYLENLTPEELLSHATLSQIGESVNRNSVVSRYLARALFVESNVLGWESFVENPQHCEGVILDRRKSILTVEPHVGLGVGLALYFDMRMLESDSSAVVIPTGMSIASLCGQQTPGDRFRFDPFAIRVGKDKIAGIPAKDDASNYESSPGYGDAKFGGMGFNANGTCLKSNACFIATDRIYKRNGKSEFFLC